MKSLTKLTVEAARHGYVTLLTWGLTNRGHPVITRAVTFQMGRRA